MSRTRPETSLHAAQDRAPACYPSWPDSRAPPPPHATLVPLVSLLLGQMAAELPGLPVKRQGVLLHRADELAVLSSGASGMGRRQEPGAESRAWLARSRTEVDAAKAVAAWRAAVTASPATASPTTPRESEVLALVAAGRSNRNIREALFVSAKTASVHVWNILAKLSARTRAEAAAVARRRGLVP